MLVAKLPVASFVGALLAVHGCGTGEGPDNVLSKDTMHAHTNRLINETSPYLLQHAHNPVDWYPWGDEAFNKAKAENKLVLVSVGYSSCHWCHVMERESFENDSVADLMNEKFVCIKVDREERPDVDQIYMTAVQLMTGRGGWPMNCFTLPDGRPVFGGTYFPRDQWMRVLQDLDATWKSDSTKVLAYAERLHAGVQQAELIAHNTTPPAFSRKDLTHMVEVMDSTFDRVDGGTDHAPKFPMPSNWQFLLKYGWLAEDHDALKQVDLTLTKMALGGIYDQVGGGFARYSVDAIWKVPHFEKMLYDNAQLVSLYAQAYQAGKDPLFKDVAERSLAFVQREMMSSEGAFYSALDADSEGEEGKFYVWSRTDLQRVLGNDFAFAEKYYNVDAEALWEHGNNILLRTEEDAAFAKRQGMNEEQVRTTAARVNAALLTERDKRVRPGLDDKSITSWNAMMTEGFCDAYDAFGTADHLTVAQKNMDLLLKKCRRDDGGLWHIYKQGKASINGYLEDYAFTAHALIRLYEVTFEEHYLTDARALTEYAITHFHNAENGMFWFTSDVDPPLITRKQEVMDNVIPASNSVMAHVLFNLGHFLDEARYRDLAQRMLNNVVDHLEQYPSGYSNWAQLLLAHAYPYYEIAITGPEALRMRGDFGKHYIPNKMFLGATTKSTLPLLEDKFLGGVTTVFVCENRVCQLPVDNVEDAMKQVR